MDCGNGYRYDRIGKNGNAVVADASRVFKRSTGQDAFAYARFRVESVLNV